MSKITTTLQEAGLSAKNVSKTYVPLPQIFLHPIGHTLRHPRADDPVRESLRDSIVEKGVEKSMLVRVEYDPVTDRRVLALCDGAGRFNAGLAAQAIMQEMGSKRLGPDGNLWVPVEFIKGDDRAFLRARQLADTDPNKKPHSIHVLAVSARQMADIGMTPVEILQTYPRGWTRRAIEKVIELWHELENHNPELVQRFNSDEVIPPGVLEPVLAALPPDRGALLDRLLGAVGDAREERVVVRRLNEELRRTAGEEPPVRTLNGNGKPSANADTDERDAAKPNAAESNAEGPNAEDSNAEDTEGADSDSDADNTDREDQSTEVKPAKTATKVIVKSVNPKTLLKLFEASKNHKSGEVRSFFAAARAVRIKHQHGDMRWAVKLLESLPEHLRASVLGVFWQAGYWSAAFQQFAPTGVFEVMDPDYRAPVKAEKPAPKQDSARKSKAAKKTPKARVKRHLAGKRGA